MKQMNRFLEIIELPKLFLNIILNLLDERK